MNLQSQVYTEKNPSSHSFQEYSNSFHHFIPAAAMEYTNFQYGVFYEILDLNVDVAYDYPTPD